MKKWGFLGQILHLQKLYAYDLSIPDPSLPLSDSPHLAEPLSPFVNGLPLSLASPVSQSSPLSRYSSLNLSLSQEASCLRAPLNVKPPRSDKTHFPLRSRSSGWSTLTLSPCDHLQHGHCTTPTPRHGIPLHPGSCHLLNVNDLMHNSSDVQAFQSFDIFFSCQAPSIKTPGHHAGPCHHLNFTSEIHMPRFLGTTSVLRLSHYYFHPINSLP